MCDTMGEVSREGGALFAKNSDRSPNEPQVAEWRPAAAHPGGKLRATYIEIDQAPETCATLLSRPVWGWGAEMGVNQHGVCIGNEAVFTRGRYGKTGLTGMDLVRLGLERADSAAGAVAVIIDLLERHGQGGNCGYDKPFHYDNSFLILDRTSLYILETAGQNWAYKLLERGSISNRLALGADGDAYSGGPPYDFAKKHLEPVYSHFSGSAHRVAHTAWCIGAKPGLAGLLRGLREHGGAKDAPLQRPVLDAPCMHAGGAFGDQTTASMAVVVDDDIRVWLTGSSTPCISLFKPWGFGNAPAGPVFAAGDEAAETYWRRREAFNRAAVGRVLPRAFYAEQHALEQSWQAAAQGASLAQLDALTHQAAQDEDAFYARWQPQLPGIMGGRPGFRRYWRRATAALATPACRTHPCTRSPGLQTQPGGRLPRLRCAPPA